MEHETTRFAAVHAHPIPVLEGRPPIIVRDGVTIYLSVRDKKHLELLKARRKRLAGSHPDKGGTSAKFLKEQKLYRRWLEQERAWYAHYGMDLPRSRDLEVTPPPQIDNKREHYERTNKSKERADRIVRGMCRYGEHPRGENGTKTMCRTCADKHVEKQRARNKQVSAARFKRQRRLQRWTEPGKVIGIYTTVRELQIWRALGIKHRQSISSMVRLSMRQKYGYEFKE